MVRKISAKIANLNTQLPGANKMTRLTAPLHGCVSPRNPDMTAADVGRWLNAMAPSWRTIALSAAIGFLPDDEGKALIDEIQGKEIP